MNDIGEPISDVIYNAVVTIDKIPFIGIEKTIIENGEIKYKKYNLIEYNKWLSIEDIEKRSSKALVLEVVKTTKEKNNLLIKWKGGNINNLFI